MGDAAQVCGMALHLTAAAIAPPAIAFRMCDQDCLVALPPGLSTDEPWADATARKSAASSCRTGAIHARGFRESGIFSNPATTSAPTRNAATGPTG